MVLEDPHGNEYSKLQRVAIDSEEDEAELGDSQKNNAVHYMELFRTTEWGTAQRDGGPPHYIHFLILREEAQSHSFRRIGIGGGYSELEFAHLPDSTITII